MTPPPPSAPAGWLSYDSVAGTYEQVAEPWFTELARDLVAAVGPRPGELVVDVGTGTGLVAEAIRGAEPTSRVIGIDPSRGMLTVACAHARVSGVVAMAPGLPLRSQGADAVVANLVVSHLPDHTAGLADMVRVLRPGGLLGCTAWAAPTPPRDDNQRPQADQIIDAVRRDLGMDLTPPSGAVRWEEWFRDPQHILGALTAAGLTDVTLREHEYRWTFSIPDFISGWGSCGRYLRHAVGEQRWKNYIDTAADALRRRFGDHITVVNSAWIATGTKPFA